MLRVGLVVPHIFMHRDILPHIIFAPGHLAISLANQLQRENVEVTLFCPGPIDENIEQVNADLSYFEAELAARENSYIELLKKHPFTFITLARQIQSELVAQAYQAANSGQFDVLHIYGLEEDIALPFAQFCRIPVVFTHHDPFNYLVKYRSVFPKYTDLNWISLSYAQRKTMPQKTNWLANIYHGLDPVQWKADEPKGNYVAYLGRIIEPKGVHMAITAIKKYNLVHPNAPLTLKIAGKHYSDQAKDSYWKERIEPELTNKHIKYVGFIGETNKKQLFLGHAKALLVPSLWSEPFGMVMIEALACGTPVIGLESGAIPEVVEHKITGFVVRKHATEAKTVAGLVGAIEQIDSIDRKKCRHHFETRFTLEKMCHNHIEAYRNVLKL